MSPEAQTRTKAVLTVLAWLLVTYLFLMVLMVAIAQQSVMAQLTADGRKASYSSSYASLRTTEQRKTQVPELLKAEGALIDQLALRQTALRQREEDYHDAWGEFLPLLRRAADGGACGFVLDSQGLDKPEVRMGMWREVEQCSRDGRLAASLRAQFQTLGQAKNSFPVSHRRALAAAADVNEVKSRLADLRTRLSAVAGLTDEEKVAVAAFSELAALRFGWLRGGNLFVEFPPALVQLLLSAISGAFGALLVTLVLIVYPNNVLGLTTSHAYGARMLLGALIAVCVYVILLSGTAVLGASNGFDAAGANYMTFCALSILAGMFSDRAAFWISSRANTFFKVDP